MGRQARSRAPLVTFDPQELTLAQRDGDACVVCHRRWPRPRVRAGRLPDDTIIHACADCAEALAPLPPRAPDGHRSRRMAVSLPVP
ncbi:hypothetical protein AB0K60_33370 [Thermopolyspora sp. NPDC052614]|uniref:hypothetical protein n=1 Tax=Thermopolyspora sp. NPDC052614 TaxID=3155682 RepID=UPI003421B1E9